MTSAFPLVAMLLARGADVRSAPMCQISRLSEQRVAPAGRKPIFGPLSKNNTGMAAPRAGVPVMSGHTLCFLMLMSRCLGGESTLDLCYASPEEIPE